MTSSELNFMDFYKPLYLGFIYDINTNVLHKHVEDQSQKMTC